MGQAYGRQGVKHLFPWRSMTAFWLGRLQEAAKAATSASRQISSGD
jgi:hypothetical protein